MMKAEVALWARMRAGVDTKFTFFYFSGVMRCHDVRGRGRGSYRTWLLCLGTMYDIGSGLKDVRRVGR